MIILFDKICFTFIYNKIISSFSSTKAKIKKAKTTSQNSSSLKSTICPIR